jgi:hypothetical protein
LPLLRQQAGRRAAPSAVVAKSGAATGKPKTTSNKMESSFLNDLIGAYPDPDCKLFAEHRAFWAYTSADLMLCVKYFLPLASSVKPILR